LALKGSLHGGRMYGTVEPDPAGLLPVGESGGGGKKKVAPALGKKATQLHISSQRCRIADNVNGKGKSHTLSNDPQVGGG